MATARPTSGPAARGAEPDVLLSDLSLRQLGPPGLQKSLFVLDRVFEPSLLLSAEAQVMQDVGLVIA